MRNLLKRVLFFTIFLLGATGATTSSAAKLITGTLYYTDGDPVYKNTQPGLNDKVIVPARLVRVHLPGGGSVHTDSKGYFSAYVNVPDNAEFKILFEGDNFLAHIFADTDCEDTPIYISRILNFRGSSTIDLGKMVVDEKYVDADVGECMGLVDSVKISASGVLNINNTILETWDSIESARDPSQQTDTIGQVEIEYCDNRHASKYNYFYDGMLLNCVTGSNADSGFVDKTIAHEYAHHVGNEISSWNYGGSHNQCEVVDEEYAWWEGFAEFIGSYVVEHRKGTEISGDGDGVCDTGEICTAFMTEHKKLDAENPCSNKTSFPERSFAVEHYVSGVLWDLQDGLSEDEPQDLVDGPQIEGFNTIIRIFDHELDKGWWGDAADLSRFHDAWVNRMGTKSLQSGQPVLDIVLNQFGIIPSTVSVAGYAASIPLYTAEKKMASHGFLEPKPVVESGFSEYFPITNSLGVTYVYSYLDLHGPKQLPSGTIGANPWERKLAKDAKSSVSPPDLIDIRLGVSNLPDPTMAVVNGTGKTGDADSATFSAKVTDLSNAGVDWLAISQGGGAPASTLNGQISQQQLTTMSLRLLPAAFTLSSGIYNAVVNVDMAIFSAGSHKRTDTRQVKFRLIIDDGPGGDSDGDGLTNKQEVDLAAKFSCIDPNLYDSDGDGLRDGREMDLGTDPCDEDTDGDGGSDGFEAEFDCFDPLTPNADAGPKADSDGDGLSNEAESDPRVGDIIKHSHPCAADSDGDGVADGSIDPDGGGPLLAGPDNCPSVPNPNQKDSNGDGLGDACAPMLEYVDWLDLIVIPPLPGEDRLPDCFGGCPPLPENVRTRPVGLLGLPILRSKGIRPLLGREGRIDLSHNGNREVFLLDSARPGLAEIRFTNRVIPSQAAYARESGAVFASVIDSSGKEIWRANGVGTMSAIILNLTEANPYLIVVAGEAGSGGSLSYSIDPAN